MCYTGDADDEAVSEREKLKDAIEAHHRVEDAEEPDDDEDDGLIRIELSEGEETDGNRLKRLS